MKKNFGYINQLVAYYILTSSLLKVTYPHVPKYIHIFIYFLNHDYSFTKYKMSSAAKWLNGEVGV